MFDSHFLDRGRSQDGTSLWEVTTTKVTGLDSEVKDSVEHLMVAESRISLMATKVLTLRAEVHTLSSKIKTLYIILGLSLITSITGLLCQIAL